jgi:hypothetical protein
MIVSNGRIAEILVKIAFFIKYFIDLNLTGCPKVLEEAFIR